MTTHQNNRPEKIIMGRRIFETMNRFPDLATRAEAVSWAFGRLKAVEDDCDSDKMLEFANACLRIVAQDVRSFATAVIVSDLAMGTSMDEESDPEEVVDLLCNDLRPDFVLNKMPHRDAGDLLPRNAFVSAEAYERYLEKHCERLAVFNNAFGEFESPEVWQEKH